MDVNQFRAFGNANFCCPAGLIFEIQPGDRGFVFTVAAGKRYAEER